jgi:PAS domain S-box-containing protein
MSNSSTLVGLQSSKQELIDEIDYLREKLSSTENALNFRQEIHHTLSGAINIGYWEWDEITQRPTYFSKEMAAILGMSQETLYQQYQCEEDFFPFVHPDDLEYYISSLNGIPNPDHPRDSAHNIEYRIIKPNGEVRYVWELEYGKLKKDGVVSHSYGAIQDITALRDSTRALSKSEQRYSALFSQLPLGVQEQDWSSIKRGVDKLQSEGVENLKEYFENNPQVLRKLVNTISVTSVNDALLDIYGYSSVQEYIEEEENSTDWLDKEWADLYASEIAALASNSKIHYRELKETRADNSVFEVRVITRIVKGDEDSWKRVITIVEDVTERKKFEIALVEAKNVAEKASKAKTEFLSSMSHELRTPMNAVIGFGQLLQASKSEPLSEKQETCVGHILNSGKHLMELVEQVLELNTIEAGKLAINFDDVPAQKAIDGSLQLIQTQAEEKAIKIVNQVIMSELPILRTDATRLTQVLLNLLSNAVKYNNKGGTVTLSYEKTAEHMLQISVIDTGIGIPIDKQQELFTPFERLGREGGNIEGTGIGLAISKQLIELLGGKIGYRSQEGQGSTFWIDVPMSRKQVFE